MEDSILRYNLLDMVEKYLPNKRVLSSFLVFSFLLLGLLFALTQVERRQEIRTEAGATDVVVSLAASKTTLTPEESFTVNVLLNPTAGNHNVSAVALVLNYPPAKLSLNQVTPGPFFLGNFNNNTEMLNIVDTATAGVVKITLGAPCTKTEPWLCYPNNQAGILVSLNFTAKTGTSGIAQINFDPQNTQGAAVGQGGDVIAKDQLTPLIINILTTVTPTPTLTPLPEIIIDNQNSAFSTAGRWLSKITTGGYGENIRVAPTKIPVRSATWSLSISVSGNYQVYAMWLAHSKHPTDVSYQIYHNGQIDTVLANQTQNGDTWNLLGTYYFDSGRTDQKIMITNQVSNGLYVCADAVRLVPSF